MSQPDNVNVPAIGKIDMVLLDEQGNKIHASLKNVWVAKVQGVYPEGCVGVIENFRVVENCSKKYLLQHRYEIVLSRSTTFKKCRQFSGSLHGFTFTKFKDILPIKKSIKYSVDVIGRVVSYQVDEKNRNGQQTKELIVYIQDSVGDIVICVLNGMFANQLVAYVSSPTYEGNLVIILQFAKVSMTEAGTPAITEWGNVTKMFMDLNIHAVMRLKLM